ncbi:hypothetical protein LTS10_011203 [Elasticomyces elasticus]|nr:hypothetical protein LTS10_011203 [Elasticomyces elasticus]
MSCSDLFEKQYKKGWELELWVMQQDPAPRKMHRWLTGGGGRGVKPITEFALSEAVSSEAVERGDFRVYMQAIIGPRGKGQWMVTGSQYEKHQDSDDSEEEEEEEEEEDEEPEDQEPDEAEDDDSEKDSQKGNLDEEEDVEDQNEGADGGRNANSTAKRPLNRRNHPFTSRPKRSEPNGGKSRSSKLTSSFTPINGNTTGRQHSGNSRPIPTTRPTSEDHLMTERRRRQGAVWTRTGHQPLTEVRMQAVSTRSFQGERTSRSVSRGNHLDGRGSKDSQDGNVKTMTMTKASISSISVSKGASTRVPCGIPRMLRSALDRV